MRRQGWLDAHRRPVAWHDGGQRHRRGGPPLICGAALTAKTLKTGGVAAALHFEGEACTYRGAGEVEALRRDEDSLQRFRRRVTAAGLLEAAQLDAVDRQVADEIEESVVRAKVCAMPAAEKLLTDVYVSY